MLNATRAGAALNFTPPKLQLRWAYRGRSLPIKCWAGQALDKVLKGDLPAWLAHTNTIIVDEVQDTAANCAD